MSNRIRAAIAQARSHQDFWGKGKTGELVYIALGDSTALGVGVEDPLQGYVGLLAARLADATGKTVRTINLAISGERSADLLRRQIPRFGSLPRPDFVTCVVGGNDVAFARRWNQEAFTSTIDSIAAGLPQHAVIGLVPSFGHSPFEYRVRRANQAIRAAATNRGLAVADLYSPTRALWPFRYWKHTSRDFFHPNGRGHMLWTDAIWPHLETQAAALIPARSDQAGGST